MFFCHVFCLEPTIVHGLRSWPRPLKCVRACYYLRAATTSLILIEDRLVPASWSTSVVLWETLWSISVKTSVQSTNVCPIRAWLCSTVGYSVAAIAKLSKDNATVRYIYNFAFHHAQPLTFWAGLYCEGATQNISMDYLARREHDIRKRVWRLISWQWT